MDTPIYNYVQKYAAGNGARLHMPGHKGAEILGCERLDITEIAGADSLYEADGIIAESEKNAASLFGTAKTLFSAEGSSQCIKAMLYLAVTAAESEGEPIVVAARNVHKSFVQAAALLDFEVVWLWDENKEFSLCRCEITPEQLERTLKGLDRKPAAVYLTSPDYLGGTADIKALAEVAHKFSAPLLVDNAHGAYLAFLDEPCHPMRLGADICCDSAHKTLPVLTGGAYLHISEKAAPYFAVNARGAMELFGSTSPSYLILQALDLANKYIAESYPQKLNRCVDKVSRLKEQLKKAGWSVYDSDPLKLTVEAAKSGYDGRELAELLRGDGIECEYADPDFTVFMFTPENKESDFCALGEFFSQTSVRQAVKKDILYMKPPEQVMSIRKAVFSKSEKIKSENAAGRVLGRTAVSCPPAVPVVVSGEKINGDAVKIFERHGIKYVDVLL